MTDDSDRTLLRLSALGLASAATGPTMSSWRPPTGGTPAGDSLTTGCIIKNRFVLEELLGRGGMGSVFRARDLRKEEARDRNPYVAIKVLNEDFRQHPDALQALQRECRKSQKLAHPNIVTVYDFDRDGQHVYMVMELLEGEPFDRLIKRTVKGLGVAEAVRIMRGICRAMDYAHEQGILHADFKPANALLTRAGVAKVFDFGIARAVELKDEPAPADGLTRFDPGTLGALTPAYAGCEVIEGQPPDPRDDLYAIACVTYELITGSHPYNRLSAADAEKARMTPGMPAGMSASAWRALRRGLAFRREGRPASATALMDGISPFRRSRLVYGAAAVMLAAIVAVLYVPLAGQITQWRERRMVVALTSGDARQIAPILSDVRALEPSRRDTLLLDSRARAGLIQYYSGRVAALVATERNRFDYAHAKQLVGELERILPDSQAVRDVRDRLVADEHNQLQQLAADFDADLEQGRLIPVQGENNIERVLAVLRQIDARSPLLSDPRLPAAFTASATRSLEAGDAALAGALATEGLAMDPTNTALLELQERAQHRVSEPQIAAAPVAPLPPELQPQPVQQSGLEAGLAKPKLTLAQARALARLIEEVPRSDPNYRTARTKLQGIMARTAAAISSKQGLDAAVEYAQGACKVFPDSKELAQTLTVLQAAAARRDATRQEQLTAAAKAEIDTLFAHPTLDDAWETTLQQQLTQLAGFAPQTDSYVTEVKSHAASVHVVAAAGLRGTGKLDEAGKLLQLAHGFQSTAPEVVTEEALLADARAKLTMGKHRSVRTTYVNGLEHTLITQAQANDVAAAQTTLRVLQMNLGADDRFLTRDGPTAIAQAYVRLAAEAVTRGQLKDAIELVNQGRMAAPSTERMAKLQALYNSYGQLDDYLTGGPVPDIHRVREEIAALYSRDPDTAKRVVPILARDLETRLHATRDPQLAGRLAQAGNDIFGPGPPFRHN